MSPLTVGLARRQSPPLLLFPIAHAATLGDDKNGVSRVARNGSGGRDEAGDILGIHQNRYGRRDEADGILDIRQEWIRPRGQHQIRP